MTDQPFKPDVIAALSAPNPGLRRPELDRSAASGAGAADVELGQA
jgi:hypothetical protein